jgi:hypothetical protein
MNNQYTFLLWLFIVIVLALLAYWFFLRGRPAPKPEPVMPEVPPFDCNIEDDEMVCVIEEEITVKLPYQTALDTYLQAVNLPMSSSLEGLESKKDQFRPHRLVLNFEAVDPKDPNNYVSEFSPPMTLRVQYTNDDVTNAGGLNELKLGYWDEKNLYWVSFSENPKYNFEIDGDETGGFVEVTVSSWGDRYIGYG